MGQHTVASPSNLGPLLLCTLGHVRPECGHDDIVFALLLKFDDSQRTSIFMAEDERDKGYMYNMSLDWEGSHEAKTEM